jgi:hypothetical protein
LSSSSSSINGGASILDTFSGSAVNTDLWQFNGTSTSTITEGALRLSSNSDGSWRVMISKKTLTRSKNATFEVNVKILSAVTQVRLFVGFLESQGASTFNPSAGLAYIDSNGEFKLYEDASNTTIAASGA